MARIGDTLLITPAITSLKKAFPDSVITVIAHKKRISILENNHDIDKLSGRGRINYLFGSLYNRKSYDIAFIYGEDGLLIKYARACGKITVGFEQKDQDMNRLLDICVKKPGMPLHAVDERLLLAKAIGLQGVERKLTYVISEAEKKWADSFIVNNGLNKAKVRIGFQTAGFPTKAYRDWPAGNFASLGQYILKEMDAKILLFGEGKDFKKALSIKSDLGENAFVIAGRTSLRQSAALISRCSAFVTTDTGPMHIAYALDVPTVAMFHCMHPGKYLGPTHNEHLHRVLQMAPPGGEKCGRNLTLEGIGSKTVWDSLKEILNPENAFIKGIAE